VSITPRRPFRLLDAMTLVAATAVGLGLARGMRDDLWSQTNMVVDDGSVGAVLLAAARWTVLGSPLIMAWTVALLPLALPRPRPGLRRLPDRPGTTACGAATLALAIGAVNTVALLVVVWIRQSLSRYGPDGIIKVLVQCLIHGIGIGLGMPGLAVTVAWATSAASGHWQPGPDWLDRAGRCLGVVWIALMDLAPWISLTLLGTWH
jgi:hypothetical protein